MTTRSPLRVGMVGAGMISRYHLTAWQRCAAAVVVAIADPSDSAARDRAGEFAIPSVFPDAHAMLDATRLDAVDIAAPMEFHADGNMELQHALKAARERGQARVAQILSGDDMLTADEFAQLLGTTRVTINSKRHRNQVLALEGATRGFRYPRWQVGDDGKPFAALPELFARLGGSPWAVYRFLVQHHLELEGMTGEAALRSGRDSEVLEVAETVVRAAS